MLTRKKLGLAAGALLLVYFLKSLASYPLSKYPNAPLEFMPSTLPQAVTGILLLIAASLIILRYFELQRNVKSGFLLGVLISLAMYLTTNFLAELFPIGGVLAATWMIYLPTALPIAVALIELRRLSKMEQGTKRGDIGT